MSQLNFYVPDELEEQIRDAAKKDGKSISAFLADLVKAAFPGKKSNKNFFSRFYGKWEGEFPSVNRDLPKERDEL